MKDFILQTVLCAKFWQKATLTVGKKVSLRGLRRLHNEGLIISAFWEEYLMVVVLNFSEQVGDTICGISYLILVC